VTVLAALRAGLCPDHGVPLVPVGAGDGWCPGCRAYWWPCGVPGRSTKEAVNAVKTHCPAGHEYDLLNTYICTRGLRNCRKCRAAAERRRRRRKTAP
jgi:hypothetical protein